VLIRGQDAACRLLQLLTTYGRKIRGPRFLAGTVAMTTFLFLRITHDLLLREAVTRGEPRIFVRVIVTPVPVLPGYPGLPDRDISTTATPPPPCGVGVQCRLTCTGLWTERRTCPRSWFTLVRRDREECVRLAHADDVPLLILPEDIPLSSVRPFAWERAPYNRTGPTKAHVLPPTREG